MDAVRRFSLLATAGSLGIAVMLGAVSARPRMSEGSAKDLATGLAYFDSTAVLARNAQPHGARGDALTVALGYLERLRLGLGSPFRLVDEAAHDPRIDPWIGKRVTWALLGRLGRGDAYVIDPAVLDGIGPWAQDGHGATGAAHLALIDRTIRSASDPRAGELAVRLAYMIASGKGTITPNGSNLAVQTAALLRDRELASLDLRDLLADAGEHHTDLMTMLVDRRGARAFRVEQPALAALSSDLRIEAMNAVASILRGIDTLDRVAALPTRTAASAPVLGPAFAARLNVLGARRPPIAQIVVTLSGRGALSPRATNDETLAAAGAGLEWASDTVRRASLPALLGGAVALRSLAQATPWFAGDAAPDAGDLVTEFGLSKITFARQVPNAWRAFYLRELQSALRDELDIFPAVSYAGLSIALGVSGFPDSALAMHEPRSRTVQLNVGTSGGTLAHELAHDLDWQTARQLFAGAGGYSTDRAVREHRGALASSVRGLAEARTLRPVVSGPGAAMPDRPAELFARGVDWFSASVLAARGRTNGYLSAVQDGTLSGYAAGAPTAMGAAGVGSLLSAIDQMTFVSDSTRNAFVAQWSDPRTIDPVLLVRRVFVTPFSMRATWDQRPASLALHPIALLPPAQSVLCLSDVSAESRVREHLLMLAVDARAHGIAARRARYRPGSMRPELANGLLGAAPWDAKPAADYVAGLRSAIVAELRAASSDQGVLPAVPASFRSSAESCSAIAR